MSKDNQENPMMEGIRTFGERMVQSTLALRRVAVFSGLSEDEADRFAHDSATELVRRGVQERLENKNAAEITTTITSERLPNKKLDTP